LSVLDVCVSLMRIAIQVGKTLRLKGIERCFIRLSDGLEGRRTCWIGQPMNGVNQAFVGRDWEVSMLK